MDPRYQSIVQLLEQVLGFRTEELPSDPVEAAHAVVELVRTSRRMLSEDDIALWYGPWFLCIRTDFTCAHAELVVPRELGESDSVRYPPDLIFGRTSTPEVRARHRRAAIAQLLKQVARRGTTVPAPISAILGLLL